jgi:hypothetical protein
MNIPMAEIAAVVQNQLDDSQGWDVSSLSVDGTDDSQPTYSMGSTRLYVMQPDQASVDRAKAAIQDILEGR